MPFLSDSSFTVYLSNDRSFCPVFKLAIPLQYKFAVKPISENFISDIRIVFRSVFPFL